MDFITYILFATGAPITATLLPLLLCRKGFTPRLVGIMLGISAGVLLSIATLDLIPEAVKMGLESSQHASEAAPHVHPPDSSDHSHHRHLTADPHHHNHEDEEIENTIKVIMSGVGIGFLVLLFVEQVATSFGAGHSHSHAPKFDKSDLEQPERKRSSAMSSIALLGLGLHSFFDGLVIAGAFEASDQVGSRVAMAIILHKFPDGLVLSSLIASAITLESISSSATLSNVAGSQSDGSNSNNNNNNSSSNNGTNSQQKSIGLSTIPRKSLYSVFAVCLATPLGAFFGRAALSGIPQLTLAFFLAFSAGSFLFITTLGILPELFPHSSHKQNSGISRFGALFSIVAGYVGFFLTSTFFGHPH
eukprot:TRINITY_DN3600_c0_g5_i1.p1 TRINITY_DN3600_c0_g5~~TRINITY_DN3600_c0_g5_i1.p1  ORF type:complete len:361 (+),score=62.51 TRINITY_DN3600_c0_g5_i1:325-1407(+)